MNYEEILQKSGFSKEQALIYSFLLKNGPIQARKMAQSLPIKRGLLYKVLDQLVKNSFIEKIDKEGAVTIFKPKHPADIEDNLEKKKKELQLASESLKVVVGQMISDFNLISGKPNVQYFEGLSGVKKVLEDSLYAKEEIYSYADLESIEKYVKEINSWYVKERNKFGIKKKGLVLDTPFNRQFLKDYYKEITDTRFLKINSEPFATVMQMYDDKISYITFNQQGKNIISILITSPQICEMHRKLFEFNWEQANVLTQPQ